MAEAFGIAVGAMSIAGLFNNCVDCFEYIHLARTFDSDFRTAQLKLDFAKLRLTRWGEAVCINGPAGPELPLGHSQDLVKNTLWQVLKLFAESARVSGKFDVPYDPNTDSDVAEFHGRLLTLTRQRKKSVSLVAKVKWALHQGNYLDKLIDQISTLIGGLEKLLPEAGTVVAARLSDVVVQEVTDLPTADLQCIEEQATGTDDLLREAAKGEIRRRGEVGQGHSVGDVTLSGEARARVGDEVSEASVKDYKPDKMSGVTTGNVTGSERSRFHSGHSIGMPSVM